MKKIILIIIMFAMLAGGIAQAQDRYYNRNNVYENFAYADYEFRHSNAAYHMERYRGNIYYFHHYRANVYFVLVGPHVFVVPGFTFRDYIHLPNFHWVSNSDFIALSAVHFPYYDSHVRFNYYNSYYDHNRWSQRNHILVTRNYRKYYQNRHSSKRYSRHMSRVRTHQARAMERARHLRHSPQRQKVNIHKSRSNYRNVYQKRYKPVNRTSYRTARDFKHRAKSSKVSRSRSGYSRHGATVKKRVSGRKKR